jgi:hypothetical protein
VDLPGEQLLLNDVVLLSWTFADATVLPVLVELGRPGLPAPHQADDRESGTSSGVLAQQPAG